jgi:probable HAF family extracellular repeat protein
MLDQIKASLCAAPAARSRRSKAEMGYYDIIRSAFPMDSFPICRLIACFAGVAAACAPSAFSATITDLGTLGGSSSYAYGINNRGEVVGYIFAPGSTHAFLYSARTMTDLGTLNGYATYAQSINDAGQIVGYAIGPSSTDHDSNTRAAT